MELIQTFKLGVLKQRKNGIKYNAKYRFTYTFLYFNQWGLYHGGYNKSNVLLKTTATQLVDKLIKSGYVKRETDKDDRRKIWINMTENGEDVIAQIMKSIESIIIEALSALEEKDLDNFSKAIDIFDSVLKKFKQLIELTNK